MESRRKSGVIAVLADNNEEIIREIYEVSGGMPLAMKLILGQITLGYMIEDIINRLRLAQLSQERFYQFIYFDTWKRLSNPAKKILIAAVAFAGSVARSMLQRVTEISDIEFSEGIAQLVQASLLESNTEFRGEKARYDVHPLTRSFIRSDLRKRWKIQKTLFPGK